MPLLYLRIGGRDVARLVEKRDPAPVLAMIGGMVAASLVEKAVDMIADKLLKPADKGMEVGGELAAYSMYKGMAIDAAIDAIRSAFFVEPRTDTAGYNIDYDRFKAVMDKLMYATIILQALISEDASELTVEMLQESLSNSLQYSLGGMWALMSAYSVGFGVPQGLYMTGEEDVHPYTLASLDAWTGQLKHFLVAQHYTRVKAEWEQAHQHDWERDIARLHELALNPHYAIAATVARKVYDGIERMADVMIEIASIMLRRVHDLAWALEAAYRDYQNGILSDHEFIVLAKSIQNSLDSIAEEATALLEDAIGLADSISVTVEHEGDTVTLPGQLEDATIQAMYNLYDRLNATINSELAEKVAKYIEALNEIRVLTKSDMTYTFKFDGVKRDVSQG